MLKQILKTVLITGVIVMTFACSPKEKTPPKHEETKEKGIDFSLNQTNFGNRLLSATDLYSTKRVSEIVLSPDGQWIVYKLSTPSIAMNKLFHDLYAVKIDGSETIQITNNTDGESNPRFTADGKKLAFISMADTVTKLNQIFVMDFPHGTPKQITNLPKGVDGFNIIGKPGLIALNSEVKVFGTIKEEYPQYDKANMMVFDDIHIRHWDTWNDEFVSHIFTVPVDGGEPKDIMNGETYESPVKPFGGAEQYDISPDMKEVTYTCKKVSDYPKSTNSDLFVYDVAAGSTKNITEGMMGYDMNPLYSPDGTKIAFISQERAGFESDRKRLMVYNRADGTINEITKTLDQWVEEYVWAPDSKSFYLVAGDSGTVQIYNLNLDGSWKIITEGQHTIGGSLQITADGKTLVFGKHSFTDPLDIFSMDIASGKMNQITNINKDLYANIKKAGVKERWFKATDGKPIQAWIVYPPDFDSTKKYPVITYCQGGPQSMISPNFHFRWSMYLLASNGYIVVAANRRGVPGFGQAWNDAISLDWGGMPMNDLLAATDQFSTEPYVNVDGRAAMGASAGGYAAFWLAGHHNKRFKAFVSHSGVFNLVSMYGSTEELFFPKWEYGGPYWEDKNKSNYEKNSPNNFVSKWDSPIFISAGMNDFRVSYTQSLEAFTAARAQGIPAELVIFPNETHFISHPQEFIIWNDKLFKFLDKYCKK